MKKGFPNLLKAIFERTIDDRPRRMMITLFFISFLLFSILYSVDSLIEASQIDEDLERRNHDFYIKISNETDYLKVQDFNFKYDFTSGDGNIYFTTSRNNTADNIEIKFIRVGIKNGSHEVACGENINTNNSTYHEIDKTLRINTSNIYKGIYSKSDEISYNINFYSNWTPNGKFRFHIQEKDTLIHHQPGETPNIEFKMGEKYKLVAYNDYLLDNLTFADYSDSNHIQLSFPENKSNFACHFIVEAFDVSLLNEKERLENIGYGVLLASIFSIVSILYHSLTQRK